MENLPDARPQFDEDGVPLELTRPAANPLEREHQRFIYASLLESIVYPPCLPLATDKPQSDGGTDVFAATWNALWEREVAEPEPPTAGS